MTNVKMSPKGKTFLRKVGLSAQVPKAIVRGSFGFGSIKGLAVNVNGTTITIKAANVAPLSGK